jgi:hypothetical protein
MKVFRIWDAKECFGVLPTLRVLCACAIAGLQLLIALTSRARPALEELLQERPDNFSNAQQGFLAPDPTRRTWISWSTVWAHLLHESAVAAPVMQLLSAGDASDRTLRSLGLQLLDAIIGLPFEVLLLHEISWSNPLCGAN